VLVTDGGQEILRAGDTAGFPAHHTNGHCFQNRPARGAQILEVGTPITDNTGYYSDIHMVAAAGVRCAGPSSVVYQVLKV
jgi:uncharacterized cupin superfamily protein